MAAPPSQVPAPVLSDRMRGVALAIGIPLGVFGAHRFYVGKTGTGILQLFTLGGFGLWWLYDMILVAVGEFRDVDGRRVAQWSRENASGSASGAQHRSGPGPEELEFMQSELRELAERVDFLERMLSQVREQGRVGGPR